MPILANVASVNDGPCAAAAGLLPMRARKTGLMGISMTIRNVSFKTVFSVECLVHGNTEHVCRFDILPISYRPLPGA
jgi:hypothetical protein